jgi:hypothetical protein
MTAMPYFILYKTINLKNMKMYRRTIILGTVMAFVLSEISIIIPLILVLSMADTWELRRSDSFQWHNVHTKFHENSSPGSISTGGRGHTHTLK